jgi:hypothetical protein
MERPCLIAARLAHSALLHAAHELHLDLDKNESERKGCIALCHVQAQLRVQLRLQVTFQAFYTYVSTPLPLILPRKLPKPAKYLAL